MIKKFCIGFLAILFVSMLFGCQINTAEQINGLGNHEEEVSQIALVEQEDVYENDVQSEEVQSEEIQLETTEDVLLNEELETQEAIQDTIQDDGNYTSKEDVALYIHTYNKLPSNYITKKAAQELGWNSKENTMAKVLPGMSIGGDRFGNYEGLLPKAEGRSYLECDIDYVSGSRNAKRIVFSNDGLIFYTEDHYSTFEQLY